MILGAVKNSLNMRRLFVNSNLSVTSINESLIKLTRVGSLFTCKMEVTVNLNVHTKIGI